MTTQQSEIQAGDVVHARTSKQLWIVESLTPSAYALGGSFARMTKLETNGEAARYVNTSRDVATLVLVEKRSA
jgi:hypothetical protein